jgi:hypothetical protein
MHQQEDNHAYGEDDKYNADKAAEKIAEHGGALLVTGDPSVETLLYTVSTLG